MSLAGQEMGCVKGWWAPFGVWLLVGVGSVWLFLLLMDVDSFEGSERVYFPGMRRSYTFTRALTPLPTRKRSWPIGRRLYVGVSSTVS